MRLSNLRIAIFAATSPMALLLSHPATAQQEQAAPMIEEVLVTAQKRTQSAQEVPIALTALTSNELDDAGVTAFESIQQGVSGVVMNALSGLMQPFIRGVGSFNANAATYQSVAVYIDDIYLARANAFYFGLDNVEQVEVLKGPQSTLYGRNATGGAISVKTATPTPGGETSGKIGVSTGNYGLVRVGGHLESSLTDTVALSLTAASNKHDGYIDNLASEPPVIPLSPDSPSSVRSESEVESLDERMLVAKLRLQPIEAIDLIFAHSRHKADDTRSFSYKDTTDSSLDEWEAYAHFGGRESDSAVTSLTANIDLGGIYLVSISALTDTKFQAQVEAYGQPQPVGGFFADWDVESKSQELRLHASPDARIQWLAGVSYFIENDDRSRLWGAAAAGLLGIPGAPAGSIATFPVGDSDWEAESSAVFGEVVYPASDKLNITVGLRNTWDKFEVTFNNIAAGDPNKNADEDWSEITYRLVADYSFDWGIGYASYSKGFVSGSYNVQNPGPVVDPEELYSAELGVKTDLMNSRLRLNAAVFNYSYEHIHAQTIDPFTGSTNLVAGNKATVNGVEFEAQFAVSNTTFAKLGVTQLIEREYDDFEVPANGSFPAIDATGNTIAGAPATSLVFNLDNETDLLGGTLKSVLNLQYLSGVYFDIDEVVGSGGANDDGYTVVNLNLTWKPRSESWSVGVFGNNLSEEHYYIGGIASGPGKIPAGITGDPRTYGVNAAYYF